MLRGGPEAVLQRCEPSSAVFHLPKGSGTITLPHPTRIQERGFPGGSTLPAAAGAAGLGTDVEACAHIGETGVAQELRHRIGLVVTVLHAVARGSA